MTQLLDGELLYSDMTKNSKGGTELLALRILENVKQESLKGFQIHFSRLSEIDNTKTQILYCHDLAEDPANNHLWNLGWKKFKKIIFVSYWQRDRFVERFSIPKDRTEVILNGVEPIKVDLKEKFEELDTIKIGYWTTPHRGLGLLAPAFSALRKVFPNIELHVFSSFGIYGWDSRNKDYEELFKYLDETEGVFNHYTVSNEEIRERIKDFHILAYPSIWQETSCMQLIEGMTAGCICIHPDLAALPETSHGLTAMYNYEDDPHKHYNRLYSYLQTYIVHIMKDDYRAQLPRQLGLIKTVTDIKHNITEFAARWEVCLENCKPKNVILDFSS